MATRLDRLLLLLESGSTPVIRKSAAQQLGEVQRLHPHELNNLLNKVHCYLGSSQWETRIAAGMAIESIANNVPQWNPNWTTTAAAAAVNLATSVIEGRLRIALFDVQKVLVHGSCLLGSHGVEYDLEENIEGLNEKEKLLHQKQMLNKRLGLDDVTSNFFQEELIKEEDFLVQQELNVIHNLPSQGSIEDLIDEQMTKREDDDDEMMMMMSSREKNKAKRKAKRQAKSLTTTTMKGGQHGNKNGESAESSCKRRKISTELSFDLSIDNSSCSSSADDNTINMDEIEDWPFEYFCDLLKHDLFSPVWEKRHGAATGLREVIKLHGKGAGRSTDTPSHRMDLVNLLWLEDLAVRLVCVLALDRFGDFVSDEVVAPVRETCAQTLGVTLRLMSFESVRNVLNILKKLLEQEDWEVRHGGLLGIKYLLAIRQDKAECLLSFVLPSIVICLEDDSDDVRAVAADAVAPVVDALVSHFPQQVDPIVGILWKILLDLDDLTSSTNSIMDLLSRLLVINSDSYQQVSLTELLPRLWPFLRHNISSVRKSAFKTIYILISKSSQKSADGGVISWLLPILPDALRHVYQRCLLESEQDLLQDIFEVWRCLLLNCPENHLIEISSIYFGSWMCLMMQPTLIPFDSNFLIEPIRLAKSSSVDHRTTSSETKYLIGGAAASFGLSASERDVVVIRSRSLAARLLGLLSSCIGHLNYQQVSAAAAAATTTSVTLSLSPVESLGNLFLFYLSSKSAVQKMSTARTIQEWILFQKESLSFPENLKLKLHECLSEVIYYDEIASLFTRLQSECRELIANLKLQGIKFDSQFTVESVLSLDNASKLCNELFESVKSKIKPNYRTLLEERKNSIQTIVTQTNYEHQQLTNRVQCSVAGAIIRLNDLPEKMNPIVRPLMDAIKKEENIELQTSAAMSIALLLPLCENRDPCPMPKIIKNVCSMLCSDSKFTPIIGKELDDSTFQIDGVSCDKYSGILSLYSQCFTPEVTTRGRCSNATKKSLSTNHPTTIGCSSSAADEMMMDGISLEDNDLLKRNLLIQRRGAVLVLISVAKVCGDQLPMKIVSLWETIFNPLKRLCSSQQTISERNEDESSAQEVVNSLQILQVVAPSVDRSLHSQLQSHLDLLSQCLKNNFTVIRHMTSRCFAVFCRFLPNEVMEYFIVNILPCLNANNTNVQQRQGCVEAMALMIEQLSIDVVPFIVLLVVPVLGRMSDHDRSVRLLATNIFATLVRLLPLEKLSSSSSSSDVLVPVNNVVLLEKQKKEERKFLEQLIDGKKIDNYKINVPLNVELRKYQQEGVNWLAFLAKYNLHGILCDDMGLGKTLQSLCILAEEQNKNKKKKTINKEAAAADDDDADDDSVMPSIVVCPPTLTGHWLYEVEKLFGGNVLKPLHYVGPPAERIRLQKLIKDYNIVLASYDVVRNDIEFFSKIKWNYCILDEGQMIKNSKTKLSKAVKQLICNHRLILSGTPIQNNVLELWSLFDFLMPGFLGTEKQFQSSFGRPILQSRDAKSSTKEQESGALAMEALHRQVLPFLLRRLKEDVLQDLPPKIVQDYFCELSPLQIQLYEDFAKSQAKKSIGNLVVESEDDNKSNVIDKKCDVSDKKAVHIFQALQYLRKVCNHPSLVLNAQHPEYDQVMNQLKKDNSSLRDLHHAPKLVALKQLLNDCGIGISGSTDLMTGEAPAVNQHRVLLFCQLKSMLDIVEQDLLKTHLPMVTYLRLDGTVPAGNRHQIVNRFNNDPSIDILLLTTHVGGLGLNLTGADTVIFFEHDWNPMKDLQAMDRAHRIGQKKVVNVYRLVTRGTLEEKIMGLQKFKINIANTVINQDNCSLSSMATDQLLDLFTVDRAASSSKSNVIEPSSSAAAVAAASGSTKPTSLKVILDDLEELWDSKVYEKEYDVDSFVASLRPPSSS